MSVLMVPEMTLTGKNLRKRSLGPQVVAWMQTYLVFGPGDLRGQPYRLDAEKQGLVCRMYEVYPRRKKTQEGRNIEGRRVFKRAGLSVRKGWAKTEMAAGVAAAELYPFAPVRFDHWAKKGEESETWGVRAGNGDIVPYKYEVGEPVGVGVKDPYIPMVAYTEEQSEELAYHALCVMLAEGDLGDAFDIGTERILVLGPNGEAIGKAAALAGTPAGTDGGRTTFQVFDETHHMDSEKLLSAHQTMLANVPKRYAADAWTLEITTSYEPGMGSVAEKTMEYAEKVRDGKIPDSRLLFFHRQAGDGYELWNDNGEAIEPEVRAAVLEASGPVAAWSDIDSIVQLALDPQTDPPWFERVWLNRPIQSTGQMFNMRLVDEHVYEDGWIPPAGDLVTIGFDGSQTDDTTAMVLTHMATGRQTLLAVWRNPGNDDNWLVPADEVNATVAAAFDSWDVWRMYADPYFWETNIKDWVAKYPIRRGPERGHPRVFEWATNSHKRMALSIKAYVHAMRQGIWSYDGNLIFREHLANARKYPIPILDDDEENLYLMRKERPGSPHKIDIAMAGCLSWEAYRDAIAAGVNLTKRSRTPVSLM